MKENILDNRKDKLILNIDLDELLHAFEYSSVTNHFFIDSVNNKIININEEKGGDYEEKLEEIENEDYIIIPEMSSDDDFLIMELFVYAIADENHNLSDELYNAIEKRKPFRNFKDILEKYPEIKEKWYKHKEECLKNELIDWLYSNNIMLEDKGLIPIFEIKELSKGESNLIPEEWRNFAPFGCMNCNNKEGIEAKIFLVNIEIKNALIDNEIRRIMKDLYNINDYGILSDNNKTFIIASRCLKCGSEEIFWDF